MKIVGFGACMVAGFPYEESKGFLMRSCQILQDQTDETYKSIDRKVVSLPSFPITRSQKYLTSKVLPLKPDFVVLQFGASDVGIAMKKHLKNKLDKKGKFLSTQETIYSLKDKLTLKHQITWFFKACLGLVLGAKPITTVEDYFMAMDKLVSTLRSHNCHCLILTPFRFGNFYSNMSAKFFRDQTISRYSAMNGVDVIDCWGALASKATSKVLLSDGIHITEEAHEIIAHLIANTIQVRKSMELEQAKFESENYDSQSSDNEARTLQLLS